MNTTETSKTNGKTPETAKAADGPNAGSEAELDMLYSLKSTIDQGNRYKYRINDMAMGFAAGRGIDAVDAKFEIIDRFEQKFGKDPLSYSDQLHEQRKNGQTQERPRGRGR